MSKHTISTCQHCGQEMHPTDYHTRLRAINAELLRLCIKALNRSSRVHPGFADELRAAIAKATS